LYNRLYICLYILNLIQSDYNEQNYNNIIKYIYIYLNLLLKINANSYARHHLDKIMKDIETPNIYEVNGEFLGPNVILNKDVQGYSYKCKGVFSATKLPFVWPPPEYPEFFWII
jgi:hypothetical protein